jgi:hypothetical protein
MTKDFRFLLHEHAGLRSAQRDIPPTVIISVLYLGDWYWQPRRQQYWKPRDAKKRRRCEVTLSSQHIPPEEFADLQSYAGCIVVLAEFSDIVTVMKRSSRKSGLPQPYIRERVRWQEYLRRGMIDM